MYNRNSLVHVNSCKIERYNIRQIYLQISAPLLDDISSVIDADDGIDGNRIFAFKVVVHIK